ncbi:MAG TPA: hypothetical protein VIM55_03055 [Mucilaginibacter sp.]
MRKNLAQTNPNQPGSDVCTSPDIIPYQKDAVAPSTFITDENWKKDLGKAILKDEYNLIYIRGDNNATEQKTGTLELNYAPSNLVMWPSQWADNRIQLATIEKFSQEITAAPGSKWAAEYAFQWKPGQLPSGADHYCLVARMNEPVPQMNMSWDQLIEWIKKPNVGWRNVNMIVGNTPTWERRYQLTLSKEANIPEVSHCYIFAEFSRNMPLGVSVSFSCAGPGADPVINKQKEDYKEVGQTIGMWSDVNKGFDQMGTLSFWANGKTIPTDASVTLSMYNVDASAVLALNRQKRIVDRFNAYSENRIITYKDLIGFEEYLGAGGTLKRVGGIHNVFKP